jgi:hypothetical protein
MKNLRLGIPVALAFVFFVACVAPIWAVDYNPGVSVGQWVKYGNITAVGSGTAQLNKTDWFQFEVTAVAGKNVTLRMTGKYKNGTDLKPVESRVNVETGWINGSLSPYSILTAANLQQGDNITKPAAPRYSIFKINSTQTRTYMGVNRSCNILNVTAHSNTTISQEFTMIWDKASGMLMESDMEFTGIASTTVTGVTSTMKISFKAIDTNIFFTGAAGWLMGNLIYIVAAVVIIIVVIGGVAIVMMIRKPPTPTEAQNKNLTNPNPKAEA